MRFLRTILSIVILCLIVGNLIAQQVPFFSQYILNGFLINPSLAGLDGYTTVNLTVREQWVGMAETPATFTACYQTRMLKKRFIEKSPNIRRKVFRLVPSKNVGLGGNVFRDNNGIINRTGINAAYAFHIPMGQTDGHQNNFSLGLALMAYQYNINTDGLIYDKSDPFLNSYDRSVIISDFNFGASYTTSKYYLGFAISNLTRGSLLITNTSEDNRNEQGYYIFTGGYKIQTSPRWVFEPSVLVKTSNLLLSGIQADISTRVYYKEDYWVGLSYRTNDAVIIMTGLKYDKFYFGYAFDFTLTEIRKLSFGTHEITLAMRFSGNPRMFR